MATPTTPQSPLLRALAGSRLPALDGLRAVAVFTVMVYHFGINAVPGDLGVSAFFVLSGFLITWLLLKEHRATGGVSLRQFYTRRVLRIFPAYYAFIALTYAADHLRGQAWPPGLASAALFYLVNYFNALHGHPTTSIAHAWSLGIEEQFYLLWPLLLLLLLRGGVGRVARGLAVMILVVVAWRCVLLFGLHVDRAYVYNAFDTRFDNLAIGCLLATVAAAPAFQGIAGRLGASPFAPLATLALLLLSRSGLGATYHYTLGFTVDALLVAVFIVQMLQLHGSPVWSWLEARVARYLGLISYPLYLWHQWGLSAGHHVRAAGPLGELIAGIGLSILLASGSYYVIERPFLALKTRFAAQGRRGRHAQLVTAGHIRRGLLLALAAIGTIALLGAFALRRLTRHRVAAVTLSPAGLTVPAGERRRIWATVTDADGRPLPGRVVTWASRDPAVAVAGDDGVVTVRTPGTTTVTATSAGRSATAAVTVTAPPGDSGLAFQSDWSTATGPSRNAVSDGGRWLNYWEFNHDTDVQLLSVVSGGPGGRNALKVLQRGPTFAANLQQDSVVAPSTDYYVRFYMRNDDTSPAGDHIVTGDTWKYTSLIYMRKFGEADGWRYVIGLYGCGYTYPVGYFGPAVRLSYGAWYRFEYYVHFVDATHAQVHPRVYDASGKLFLSDADFHQSDPGQASWNDRSDWTLASYYAAGHSFCVSPRWLASFGMGNNGQDGAMDTGRAWYFAGVAIRTDHWPGP